MSQPVVQVTASRAGVAISGQSIIVLIFLGIIAYVLFFSGSDDSKTSPTSSSDPAAGVDPVSLALPPSPVGSLPSPSGTAATDISTPFPLSATSPPSPGIDGVRSFTPDPSRWIDEDYDPTTLRPLSASSSRSVGSASAPSARGWDKPRRQHGRVQIPQTAEDEIVHTHPDDMMRGGGTQSSENWKDWKARELSSPGGPRWNPQPAPTPAEEKKYRIKQDVEASRAKVLFGGMTLAPGMFERVCQLEMVARQDGRGVVLGPVGWDASGKAVPVRGDVAADTMVVDDPGAEGWDPAWGILPVVGIRAAEQVARVISAEDIETLGSLMQKRERASVADSKRSWKGFVSRASEGKDKLDQERLTIGWFADTFRSVAHPVRMCISNQFVDMRSELPLAANALQWLEAMAWHLRRQRLFSAYGVDLHGLALRLALPCTRLDAPVDGSSFRYDLELSVFMWGGPGPNGKEDGMREWIERMKASVGCLRSARTDIATTLHEFDEPDQAINSLCKRRRVIFRPGYTAFGVNNSNFNADDSVDRSRSHSGVIARDPEVVTYPADLWAALKYRIDRELRKLLITVYPQEAGIFNSRQYQWNTQTLTSENNKLSDLHLLTIMRALGPAMIPDPDDQTTGPVGYNHTVEFLDFGPFVPLVRRESGGVKFFPLDAMYALAGIVIPFVGASSPSPEGQTAKILLDESYGILPQLASRRISNAGSAPTDENLAVFVTVSTASHAAQLRQEIVAFMQGLATQMIHAAAPSGSDKATLNAAKRRAREEMDGWIDRYLASVCIVDQSASDDSQKMQGNLRFMDWTKLDVPRTKKWPKEFQDS